MTEPLSGFVDYWESIPLFESQKELPDSTRRKIRQEERFAKEDLCNNQLVWRLV